MIRMITFRKPRFSFLQVVGILVFVTTFLTYFERNKVQQASSAHAVEIPSCPDVEIPSCPDVKDSTHNPSNTDGNIHIRLPSRDRNSHDPLQIPGSVDSVVTYIDAAQGVPAVMAYRARCAEADWNSNHKNLLFTQAGYNELRNIDVAIDIGACYGDTAVPIAVNSKQVIAFEPNPFSYDVLELNSLLNPHLNINTHNYAVGANDGDILKFTYGGDMCNGGIEGSWKDSSKETPVEVKTINLHAYLSREYGDKIFERIDYIKIDTEGYDASILRSLNNMIPLLKDSVLIQVEWFDYFDTSRHGGDAGPREVSEGSAELFSSISSLGLSAFYDFNCTVHARGPENVHYSPDLYLKKKKKSK